MIFAKMSGGASLAAVQAVTPPQLRGTVTAVLIMSGSILSAGAPPAIGLINDQVFEGGSDIPKALVVFVVPVLLIASLGLAAALQRSKRRDADAARAPTVAADV